MSQVVGCTAARNTSLSELWTIKSTQGRPCGPLQAAVLGRRQHYDAWTALLPFVRNVVILGRYACAHDWAVAQPSCVAVMAWDQVAVGRVVVARCLPGCWHARLTSCQARRRSTATLRRAAGSSRQPGSYSSSRVPGSSSSMSPTRQGHRQAVYLHFGDRSGLLVALVDYIDVSLGAVQLRAHPRWRHRRGEPAAVDPDDELVHRQDRFPGHPGAGEQPVPGRALATAWRDRMDRRQQHIRSIVERIAAEGGLAEGWSVDALRWTSFMSSRCPGPGGAHPRTRMDDRAVHPAPHAADSERLPYRVTAVA